MQHFFSQWRIKDYACVQTVSWIVRESVWMGTKIESVSQRSHRLGSPKNVRVWSQYWRIYNLATIFGVFGAKCLVWTSWNSRPVAQISSVNIFLKMGIRWLRCMELEALEWKVETCFNFINLFVFSPAKSSSRSRFCLSSRLPSRSAVCFHFYYFWII